jgi:conjugative transfer signal peptidase TraF
MSAKTPALICVSVLVSATVLRLCVDGPRIAFNGSQSAPIGFYLLSKKEIGLGDLVLTRLPVAAEQLIAARGYLPSPMPVFKEVVALAGDRFCRFGTLVHLNDAVVATALRTDLAGRELPRWQGCKVLSGNEVALLMPHPRSFDSRYFGPIFRDNVIGVATPIWTWKDSGPMPPMLARWGWLDGRR